MTDSDKEFEVLKDKLRKLLESPFFEGFIYLCILYNIVTVALNDIYVNSP